MPFGFNRRTSSPPNFSDIATAGTGNPQNQRPPSLQTAVKTSRLSSSLKKNRDEGKEQKPAAAKVSPEDLTEPLLDGIRRSQATKKTLEAMRDIVEESMKRDNTSVNKKIAKLLRKPSTSSGTTEPLPRSASAPTARSAKPIEFLPSSASVPNFSSPEEAAKAAIRKFGGPEAFAQSRIRY